MKRQITLSKRSLRSARFSTSPQAAKPVLHKTYLRPQARLIPIVHLHPPTPPPPPNSKSTTDTLKFKGQKVSSNDAQQLLDYLNQLQDIALLVEEPSLGRVVAQRIFERKKTYSTFNSLTQLENIAGFGPVKFKDLIVSAKA